MERMVQMGANKSKYFTMDYSWVRQHCPIHNEKSMNTAINDPKINTKAESLFQQTARQNKSYKS